MAIKKIKQDAPAKVYTVKVGCNTSDETRYEIGAEYYPGNHPEKDTLALIEMGCLEESE
jgi:hypothetical protein